MTDREHLAVYAATGSAAAFAKIVERHSAKVYATCWRILEDRHAAEDAAQATFLVLSRKAKTLSRKTILSGWLFLTAKTTALTMRRAAVRRKKHEREAAAMRDKRKNKITWQTVKPELDAAIASLPGRLRDAFILRHVDGLSEAEVARELDCKRSAVAMRVSRAKEKLVAVLRRKGIVASAVLLISLVTENVAMAAPVGLATKITSVCCGATVASSSVLSATKGAINMLFWAKVKMAMIVTVVVATGVATPVVSMMWNADTPTNAAQAATEPSSEIAADTVRKPNWPLKVVTWDFGMAYPGAKYDFRLGVTGGTYPYKFKLTKGPKGLTVDENTGTIEWLAPKKSSKNNKVTILITDSEKKTITHSYSINVTKKGFYFVSPTGNDANSGSFKKPWKSMAHARKSSQKGNVLYFRQGTYPVKKKMKITGKEAHVWMSWPGETATIDRGILTHVTNDYLAEVAGMEENGNYLFQGFEFIHSGEKVFRVWTMKNGIFRKNKVHAQKSSGGNNPGFVMFLDAGKKRPADGYVHHNNIIFQENHIYDIRNMKHGKPGGAAGIICYNVSNLLFEDNRVHDIDGNGINDKDDGYFNTIRNNIFYNVVSGVLLMNQYTQLNTDVSHNLVFNAQENGITIGYQGGYIKNIYVHHNTLINNSIWLRWVIAEKKSENFNIYNNIIIGKNMTPYWSEFPSVMATALSPQVRFNENLLWNAGGNGKVVNKVRYKGNESYTFKAWQEKGKDKGSIFKKIKLDKNYRLPKDSPYIGKFGRQVKNGSTLMDKALLGH